VFEPADEGDGVAVGDPVGDVHAVAEHPQCRVGELLADVLGDGLRLDQYECVVEDRREQPALERHLAGEVVVAAAYPREVGQSRQPRDQVADGAAGVYHHTLEGVDVTGVPEQEQRRREDERERAHERRVVPGRHPDEVEGDVLVGFRAGVGLGVDRHLVAALDGQFAGHPEGLCLCPADDVRRELLYQDGDVHSLTSPVPARGARLGPSALAVTTRVCRSSGLNPPGLGRETLGTRPGRPTGDELSTNSQGICGAATSRPTFMPDRWRTVGRRSGGRWCGTRRRS
jgi:hypothetical protein